ncbi:vascular endothelial growth factor D-like isoform X2 [Antedon mediterranea]|uniref:vascular endothelial growth factor D-like isoform X2 n=1 Tax=Antedon mediterranea TaxID=105859 RepID=UPI003AF5C7BC
MWPCSCCSQFSRLLHLGLLTVCFFGVLPSSQQIPHSLRYHLKDVRTAEEFRNVIRLYSFNDQQFENNKVKKEVALAESSEDNFEIDEIKLRDDKTKDGNIKYDDDDDDDDKPEITELPKCDPRATVVEVPKDDPNVFFYPPCVELEKCSGCCTSDLYECTAVKSKPVVVHVIVYGYLSNSGNLKEPYPITMQEDVSCECLCKVQKKHCNLNIHQYTQCSCQCIAGRQTCSETMYWDAQTCSCICHATPQQRICAKKRQVFDEELCRCDCKRHARERCQSPRVFNEFKCKCEDVLPSKTTSLAQVHKCLPTVCPLDVSFNLQSCQCDESETELNKYTTKSP